MGLTAARFVLPVVAVLAASLCAASLRTMAQEPVYPDRPLTMVVTFTAGGSSDVLARAVADAMSRGLGKQVVVDNRPGAAAI
jgi:tripartite-type tricarboxylate transporter receptor subunit TctC